MKPTFIKFKIGIEKAEVDCPNEEGKRVLQAFSESHIMETFLAHANLLAEQLGYNTVTIVLSEE
jgi:hypothetical protein